FGDRLSVVRNFKPPTVDSFVDAGNEVRHFRRRPVLHFHVSSFDAHLPSKIAINVYLRLGDRGLSFREGFVILKPVFLLRLPTYDHRFSARTYEGYIWSLRPNLGHRRAVVKHR